MEQKEGSSVPYFEDLVLHFYIATANKDHRLNDDSFSLYRGYFCSFMDRELS